MKRSLGASRAEVHQQRRKFSLLLVGVAALLAPSPPPARASATAMAATNPLDDDDAAIIAQFWTEDARVPVHAVSQSVYSVVFCEPIERLIIDRFGPKEVRPCTKKRFEELQEKGLHNHIWD